MDENRADLDSDGVADAVELWQNEIAYVLVAGADAAWLTESPTSGSVVAGGSQSVTVAFNTAGLAAGTYRANVIIASNDPDENPVIVPVTMVISAAVPDIDVTPTSLSKTLAPGQTGTSTLTIRNTGQAALNWQISENPAAAWLSENPTTGSIAVGGSQDVAVNFSASGLTVGTYQTNLIIASDDPDENPVVVPVTMIVGRRSAPVSCARVVVDLCGRHLHPRCYAGSWDPTGQQCGAVLDLRSDIAAGGDCGR